MTANFVLLDAVDLTYRAGEDQGSSRSRGEPRRRQGEFAAIVPFRGKSTVLKLVSVCSAQPRARRSGARREGPVKIAGMAFRIPPCCRGGCDRQRVVPLKIVSPTAPFRQQRAVRGTCASAISDRLSGSQRHPGSFRWMRQRHAAR
jgi:hypothetical protein